MVAVSEAARAFVVAKNSSGLVTILLFIGILLVAARAGISPPTRRPVIPDELDPGPDGGLRRPTAAIDPADPARREGEGAGS